MSTLVLLRHGQSEWNLENRFTGFKDVELSPKGIEEAKAAGRILKEKGFKFDAIFTSVLKRAINTTELALKETVPLNDGVQVQRFAELNERDYGDLTGLNKEETRLKYGDEQFKIWRRGYDTPPPGGESLKDVVENRVRPWYAANLKELLKGDKTILIAAHGNSLRALLIVLGLRTPENINETELATGEPMIFEIQG
ncbi:MAG: 2,3-bisphosphoglycerate-dependent phosphoglycerate mutase [Alphaproteobacteria bacterium]|nr:2,3-bisphosphoglycerate-dependent phosphoglycerate mutase [Alphaproteobacteria bacterium]